MDPKLVGFLVPRIVFPTECFFIGFVSWHLRNAYREARTRDRIWRARDASENTDQAVS